MKKKVVGALALVAALALASNAGAISLSIGDIHELGNITRGTPAGDPHVPGYISQLVGMGVNTSVTIGKNTFSRSDNSFGSLNDAVLLTPNNALGNSTHIDLSSLGIAGAEYLSAKYGGKGAGTEVWYIGGQGTVFDIPASWGQSGLSKVDVFTASNSVPDGGATVVLLGLALIGIGSLRRRFGTH